MEAAGGRRSGSCFRRATALVTHYWYAFQRLVVDAGACVGDLGARAVLQAHTMTVAVVGVAGL
jgi:hypothetical protein